MDTLNQSKHGNQKERELVKQLDGYLPGMEKLYEKLSVHEKQVDQWFAKMENGRKLIQNDPRGCLKEILGDDFGDIEEQLRNLEQHQQRNQSVGKQGARVKLTSSNSEYDPASVNYANGWDVISANTIPIINKAFEVAYNKFCIKNGNIKTFTFTKEIKSDETESVKYLEVSMDIPTLSITGANGTMMRFTTGKTNVSISIQEKGVSDVEKFTIANCWVEVKINLSNAVITTANGDQVFTVFIGVVESSQDNDMLDPEVKFHGDRPDIISNFLWKSILSAIGDGMQNLIAQMEPGKEYKICSVNISKETEEKMKQYDWLLPNMARFNTQSDAEGSQLENYALVIFMMTSYSFHSGLNLDVPVNTLRGKGAGTVALSGPIFLKNVILKMINDIFATKYKIKDAFDFAEENESTHAYLKIADGRSLDIILPVKDLPIVGDKDLPTKLSKAQIRLMDEGIHLQGKIKTSLMNMVSLNGTFKIILTIKGTPNDKGISIDITGSTPDLDIETSPDWGYVVIALFGLFFGFVGSVIINSVMLGLIYGLDDILNINDISEQINLTVDKVVDWKGIDLVDIASFELSYGARIGYELKVIE